jgi:hypothetical protein
MSRIATHLVVVAAALTAGAAGAAAVGRPEPAGDAATIRRLAPGPEQVRTVVITRTIHRVRHVHVRPRRPPAAATPPVAAAAPAPAPVVAAAPPRRVAAAAPLRTRTSGGSGHGGGERETEGGSDD